MSISLLLLTACLCALAEVGTGFSFSASTRRVAVAVSKNHHYSANSVPSRSKYLSSSHSVLYASTDDVEEADAAAAPSIPTYLPSERGIDYVPLATMLATGDFEGADQFTRDALIKISAAASAGRPFVYWTEVKDLPSTDLTTMERLWLEFSGGSFGYSIQKRIWDQENGDFDNFIRRIGWTKIDNGNERKLKWFPPNEFIYDLSKAPKGHLPLTSALRGTQLLKQLMKHPVWEKYDWKNYKTLKWEPK
jgi:GUN4-like